MSRTSKKVPVPGYKPASGPVVARKTGHNAPVTRGQLPPKVGLQGRGPEWDHLVKMARLGA